MQDHVHAILVRNGYTKVSVFEVTPDSPGANEVGHYLSYERPNGPEGDSFSVTLHRPEPSISFDGAGVDLRSLELEPFIWGLEAARRAFPPATPVETGPRTIVILVGDSWYQVNSEHAGFVTSDDSPISWDEAMAEVRRLRDEIQEFGATIDRAG